MSSTTRTLSVLGRATTAALENDPFPHMVVRPALDSDLYEELSRSFPPAELFVGSEPPEGNRAYPISASQAFGDARVSSIWKDFLAYHTSADFFSEVLTLFGDSIHATHPGLAARLGKPLRHAQTSVRFAEPMADIALDCQFFYCSPPIVPATTSRLPHIDREVALYGGLLYLRLPGDDSVGADLQLYRLRGEERSYEHNRAVPLHLLQHVKTIPYAANTLVFFLNSPDSIHGVSVRSVTPVPRRHINFMAQLRDKVFDISPYAHD